MNSLLAVPGRRPALVLWVAAIVTLVAGLQLLRIRIDTDPENMLPESQPDRVFHNLVEERFALHDAIVVGLVNEDHPEGIWNARSLGALHRLTGSVLGMEGVIARDLMSLAVADNITQGESGELRFEWMMREPPATDAEALRIRDQVARLPLLLDTLVSGDGRAAAIYVPIESKDQSYRIASEIGRLAAGLDTPDVVHITGLPVAEDTFGVEMFVQMGVSAPLAGLMIFLLMWYFFGSWQLIVAPLLVAMATVIITMGLLTGLGYTVHIMSSMIPIFLMPIAVVDSVHIMSEFIDRHSPQEDPATTMRAVVAHLFRPMLFTSLTSAVGFLSLVLTPIPPVQVFGAFVAVGIMLALVLTVTLVPAWVARLTPRQLARLAPRHGADAAPQTTLARALRAIGRVGFSRRAPVIAGAAALLVAGLAGILRIEINDNPVRWFKADHRIRIADAVLNRHFAGTYDAHLVLTRTDDASGRFAAETAPLLGALRAAGVATDEFETRIEAGDFDGLAAAIDDALFEAEAAAIAPLEALLAAAEASRAASRWFQQPEALAWVQSLQAALAESGYVGKTNALPDVVKVVNRELRGGGAEHYRIPGSAEGVAQTLLQYQSSHRPQDLWHMVTPDLRSTTIWLQMTSGDNQDMTRVIAALDAHLAANPPPADVEVRWAGKTFINVVWQQSMVSGMLWSLLGAFATVFVMMVLLFRSLREGLLAMLPLTLTIISCYGLIGWIGKDYDMPIAVLSALTLGLSVDFAIHFIERLRALRADDPANAQRRLFEEPARAIARNALVIALGFTPLLASPLVPYVTVGLFMASIMLISALATLLLLPAVIGRATAAPTEVPA
jgi:predicted RND superfamily exporter protein